MDTSIIQEYTSFSTFFPNQKELALPVSKKQIAGSIKKIGMEYLQNVTVFNQNIAILTYQNGKTEKVKYYTCRESASSKLPWYAISETTLEKLPKDVSRYILIFWEKQHSGNMAPLFTCIGKIEQIKEQWDNEAESRKYRLNFKKNEDSYSSGNFVLEHHGSVQMSREAE